MKKNILSLFLSFSLLSSVLSCVVFCSDEIDSLIKTEFTSQGVSYAVINAELPFTDFSNHHEHHDNVCLTICNLIVFGNSYSIKKIAASVSFGLSLENFLLKTYHTSIFRPPIS